MRLMILGATGGTGRALVGQARERGHEVTAFVRSPQKPGPLADRVTVRTGDPRSVAELRAALPGHDAVVSALGPPGRDRRRSSEPAHAARWTRCRPAVRAG